MVKEDKLEAEEEISDEIEEDAKKLPEQANIEAKPREEKKWVLD